MASVSKVRHKQHVAHVEKKSKDKNKHSSRDHKVVKSADKAIYRGTNEALLHQAKKWTSERKARRLLNHHGQRTYERVIKACESIWKLSPKLGLKEKELFDLAVYIETKLDKKVKKGKKYFRRKETNLARTIEYDKKTKRTFIHLKNHNSKLVGKGWHKEVTYSIKYQVHNPLLVVNCVGDKTVRLESKVLKKLQGKEGIPITYASTKHRDKATGEKVYALLQKPYNAHSMRTYQYKLQPITQKEQLIMAKDVAHGLENMHEARLAHCDLHGANILCDRRTDPATSSENFSCTLIDFGQVKSFDKAKKIVPYVETPRGYTPPETIVKRKHRVDVRKVESFALGWNLYFLYFGKKPEWSESKTLYKLKHKSRKEREKFKVRHENRIARYVEQKKSELNSPDPIWNQFGKIILELCNPDPKKRPTAHKARKAFENLLKNSQQVYV